MHNLKGQIINGYEFLERIAFGSSRMTVYLAQHLRSRREVLIRVVPNTSEAVRRYEIEARIIGRFKHPNIIAIHDYWRDEALAFLVTRWLRGGSLDKALQEGCWELGRTLQMMERIAEPLALIHKHQIVHCNLRPASVLLDAKDRAFLSDFSQAVELRRYRPNGSMLFPPAYAAPEQWLGERVSPQTDIYSLGIILFETLTGNNPFTGSLIAKLKHLNEPLPSLAEFHATLPPALDEVLQRATAKTPQERYASVTEFMEALRAAANSALSVATAADQHIAPGGTLGATQAVSGSAVFTPGAFIGATLGKHRVESFIARGGMGEVYKGSHVTLGSPVAIKVLPPEFAHDPASRARFEREARVVANLDHPGIVRVFDFGSANGTYYIVMQYIVGHSLLHHLNQWGALSIEEARPLITSIADALDYAHEQGLVHRDIKPSNIVLRYLTGQLGSYQPILLDFGITKLDTDPNRFTTGAMGTFSYMAPEQFSAAKDVTRAADIYALGVMTYQILTGRLPFTGEPAQIMFAHLNVSPVDPRLLAPHIPDSAAEALLRVLAKDPAERFASAGEFAERLNSH